MGEYSFSKKGTLWLGYCDSAGSSYAVAIAPEEFLTVAELVATLREKYRDLDTALKELKGEIK